MKAAAEAKLLSEMERAENHLTSLRPITGHQVV